MKALYALTLLFLSFSLMAKDVTYEVDGKTYQGYAINKGAKAPLVILMHDWDGLTQYEKDRSKMLSKLGYSVFALDLFGKGVRPTEDKDKKQHTGELYKDRVKMRKIMNAAIAKAQQMKMNTNNAVAMGYCFGGAATLELARSGANLKGFATFHGGLSTPPGQNYKNAKGKILILHGTADTAITMNDFAELANELEEAKIPHTMVTFGGAPHAFTVKGSKRYNKEADLASWSLFERYLKRTLK